MRSRSYLRGLGLVLLLSLAQPALAGSSVLLVSAPGDYIGQGGTYQYNDTNAQITANGVQIQINGAEYWYFDFAPPQDIGWQPGTFAGALAHPWQGPFTAGLSFFGEGRGCGHSTGWFEVIELSLVDHQLENLAVDFVQRCESSSDAPLFGAIRFNSAVPLNRDVIYAVAGRDVGTLDGEAVQLDGSQSYTRFSSPLQYSWQQISGPTATIANAHAATTAITPPAGGADMEFELTVSDGAGHSDTDTVRIVLRGPEEQQSYMRVDTEPGEWQNGFEVRRSQHWLFTGDYQTFDLVLQPYGIGAAIIGDSRWYMDFGSADGAPLAAGSYEEAEFIHFRSEGHPGMDVSFTDVLASNGGGGCGGQLIGRFDVLSVQYDGSSIQSAAIDFEQHCVSQFSTQPSPGAFGQLRFNVVPAELPTANAGRNKSAGKGKTVTLDGTGSSDDGVITAYHWTQFEGATVELDDPDSPTPQFEMPGGGKVSFRLQVTDDAGNKGFDTVSVGHGGGGGAIGIGGLALLMLSALARRRTE